MKKFFSAFGLLILIFLTILASNIFYVVNEWDQVIITQFGKPVGEPITKPGLHARTPFVQKVNRIERRVLEWDGSATEMPTRDKLYILVDTFARWEIEDPLKYFLRLRDERSARSRLDDILGSETRNSVAKHDLIEIIRTTKDRIPESTGEVTELLGQKSGFQPIKYGRVFLEKEIFKSSAPKLSEFGIRLLDVRFKRVNYNPQVESRIFERMISERQQIAERFRSEGAGQAARILGDMDREVRRISSEAYKKVETIKGGADAKATAIYAAAYDQNSRAREFYQFKKTLETYGKSMDDKTSLLLSTDSDLMKLLKNHKQTQ